ncbi:hypothetical protein [Frigidibacter oleivorans]|uniref:hypothetical protein n=1 Tax=Frigidibacter oleivorans TaxID=2487129 RepID=UPI000F8DBC30|nr:hypothetical protein [Frigidibacter oleivorans]
MRRLILACCLLPAACGPDPAAGPVAVPADMLTPCSGWTGPAPVTQGALLRAALAEKAGRLCANDKIASIDQILRSSPEGMH